MAELDQVIHAAVARQDAPFLVAMTGNSDGVMWSGCAGQRSPGQPATLDTVFRIFSMTNAVGSMAAMILIDRGQLSADTEVEALLPEFAGLRVLDGFDGSTPRLRAPRTKATVRHLATHTSGLVYEFWNADVPRYMEAAGHPTILSGLVASMNYPLMFEPGTRWDYGVGIDWLGRVVEKVDGRNIARFCREEIFDPLAMPDTCFEVEDRIAARLASVGIRGADGQFADFAIAPPANPQFYGMRLEEDEPGMRAAGSQGWAGVLNTHYWFDPKNDLAGLLMTQSLPFVEPRFAATYEAFERAAYRSLDR